MKMNGEQLVAAPQKRVWEALNNPDVLMQCIPGCQSLEKEADDRLKAVVAIKIGPIGAKFNGTVTLSELDPPNSYVISGEGQGGTAGFAKGGAKVSLVGEGDGTRLTYTVDAEVGGRLAQVGGPIIDATAKQLAGVFFRRFGEIVAGPAATAEPISSAHGTARAAINVTSSLPASLPAATPIGGLPAAFSARLKVERAPGAFYWIVTLFLAALAGFLLGSDGRGAPTWLSLAIGVALAALAVFSFECGRRAKPAG
jgi:carbon monoxide dehydrogenase subunit G